MTTTVCVFCSSSDAVSPALFDAARDLGALVGGRGWTLVYGGTTVGLMGAVADAARAAGARTIGVIPEAIERRGIAHGALDELIVTREMRSRKAAMEERADAFIVLPGGFGTLEEALEILTLKQLGYHRKPVVFLNTDGFFEPLMRLFDHLVATRVARPEFRALHHLASTPAEALDHIANYRPPDLPSKWF